MTKIIIGKPELKKLFQSPDTHVSFTTEHVQGETLSVDIDMVILQILLGHTESQQSVQTEKAA